MITFRRNIRNRFIAVDYEARNRSRILFGQKHCVPRAQNHTLDRIRRAHTFARIIFLRLYREFSFGNRTKRLLDYIVATYNRGTNRFTSEIDTVATTTTYYFTIGTSAV